MNVFRIAAFALLALIGISSFASAQPRPSMAIGGDRLPTEEEKKAARDREAAAKAALDRVPTQQKTSNDPWFGARDATPTQSPPATNLVPKQQKAAQKKN
jgi:hypothetical protein